MEAAPDSHPGLEARCCQRHRKRRSFPSLGSRAVQWVHPGRRGVPIPGGACSRVGDGSGAPAALGCFPFPAVVVPELCPRGTLSRAGRGRGREGARAGQGHGEQPGRGSGVSLTFWCAGRLQHRCGTSRGQAGGGSSGRGAGLPQAGPRRAGPAPAPTPAPSARRGRTRPGSPAAARDTRRANTRHMLGLG